jgi:hypothetical protein
MEHSLGRRTFSLVQTKTRCPLCGGVAPLAGGRDVLGLGRPPCVCLDLSPMSGGTTQSIHLEAPSRKNITPFSVPFGWARWILCVVPPLIVYILLLGIVLDGCRSFLFVSDTMNNRNCARYELDGRAPRWSAIISRWTLWHAFFLCELAKRMLFLRRSRLRTFFAGTYIGLGLCALYSQGISLMAHGIFGGLWFFAMCFELSFLWYPPCASCSPIRADRGGLAVSILMWGLCVTLFILYFGAELDWIPDVRVGPQVRVAALLQWVIVTFSQAIYFARAPILIAEKRRAASRNM